MAIIGDRDYWSYPSGRSVRLYSDGCVVNSGTGLMGLCMSHLFFGNEDHHFEVRCRIIEAGVLNKNTTTEKLKIGKPTWRTSRFMKAQTNKSASHGSTDYNKQPSAQILHSEPLS